MNIKTRRNNDPAVREICATLVESLKLLMAKERDTNERGIKLQVEMGDKFIELKRAVTHGMFQSAVHKLDVDERHAQRLMRIAKSEIGEQIRTEGADFKLLPRDVQKLEILAALDRKELEIILESLSPGVADGCTREEFRLRIQEDLNWAAEAENESKATSRISKQATSQEPEDPDEMDDEQDEDAEEPDENDVEDEDEDQEQDEDEDQEEPDAEVEHEVDDADRPRSKAGGGRARATTEPAHAKSARGKKMHAAACTDFVDACPSFEQAALVALEELRAEHVEKHLQRAIYEAAIRIRDLANDVAEACEVNTGEVADEAPAAKSGRGRPAKPR